MWPKITQHLQSGWSMLARKNNPHGLSFTEFGCRGDGRCKSQLQCTCIQCTTYIHLHVYTTDKQTTAATSHYITQRVDIKLIPGMHSRRKLKLLRRWKIYGVVEIKIKPDETMRVRELILQTRGVFVCAPPLLFINYAAYIVAVVSCKAHTKSQLDTNFSHSIWLLILAWRRQAIDLGH